MAGPSRIGSCKGLSVLKGFAERLLRISRRSRAVFAGYCRLAKCRGYLSRRAGLALVSGACATCTANR